jgi:hypothetical protein
LDSELQVVWVSKAFKKSESELNIESDFTDFFQVLRPNGIEAFVALDNTKYFVQIESKRLKHQFKCIKLNLGSNRIFLACNPIINESASPAKFNLEVSDYATHDIMAEFVFLLKANRMGMAEANELIGELSRKNRELELARTDLVQLNDRLEAKADRSEETLRKAESELNLNNAISSFNNDKLIEKTQREIAYHNESLEEVVEQTKLELEAKNQQINQGLEFANLMQIGLISDSKGLRARFSEVDTLYRPYDHVSGDLYGIYPTFDDNTMIVLGDATGHGVAGSILSNICLSILDEWLELEHYSEPFNLITAVLTKFKKLSSNASNRALQGMIALELTALSVNRDKDTINFASNSKQLTLFKHGAMVQPVVETFQCCTGNSQAEQTLKHRSAVPYQLRMLIPSCSIPMGSPISSWQRVEKNLAARN